MQELDSMISSNGKRNLTKILCAGTAIMMASMLSACTKDNSKYKPTSGETSESVTSVASGAVTTTAGAVDAAATTAASNAASAPDDLKVGWCNASTMNIRSGAGKEFGAVGGLHQGDKVTILGKEGDWFKIKCITSKTGVGYVSAQYISATEVAPASTAVPTTTAAANQ